MTYSLGLLKLMGIDIAQDIVKQTHDSADQRLWRHVLLNAFEDARLHQSDRKSSIYKMEAHEWISQDCKDFQTICWWSGWDPEEVRSRYFKAVKKGEITFNDRQVKWIKYYKKYLELKKIPTKEQRAPVRRALIIAREAVLNATSTLVSNFIISQQS
tara:strand:+ start:1094 stop:1564 length:471 start_codon:yes stop_codon:yes gene_type:complete